MIERRGCSASSRESFPSSGKRWTCTRCSIPCTYLGIATTPVLLVDKEEEKLTEEDIVFLGELPRKWRLREIIERLI